MINQVSLRANLRLAAIMMAMAGMLTAGSTQARPSSAPRVPSVAEIEAALNARTTPAAVPQVPVGNGPAAARVATDEAAVAFEFPSSAQAQAADPGTAALAGAASGGGSAGFGAAQAAMRPGGRPSIAIPIDFRKGSNDIDPAFAPVIANVAAAMARNAGWKIAVEGHTDASGSRQANWELSRLRAETVVRNLVAAGVAADRLAAVPKGQDEPMQGLGPRNKRNRRVEFVRVN